MHSNVFRAWARELGGEAADIIEIIISFALLSLSVLGCSRHDFVLAFEVVHVHDFFWDFYEADGLPWLIDATAEINFLEGIFFTALDCLLRCHLSSWRTGD
jgi:hypothetical protein